MILEQPDACAALWERPSVRTVATDSNTSRNFRLFIHKSSLWDWELQGWEGVRHFSANKVKLETLLVGVALHGHALSAQELIRTTAQLTSQTLAWLQPTCGSDPRVFIRCQIISFLQASGDVWLDRKNEGDMSRRILSNQPCRIGKEHYNRELARCQKKFLLLPGGLSTSTWPPYYSRRAIAQPEWACMIEVKDRPLCDPEGEQRGGHGGPPLQNYVSELRCLSSTRSPACFQASKPPKSGWTFFQPWSINACATRALDASCGHVQ